MTMGAWPRWSAVAGSGCCSTTATVPVTRTASATAESLRIMSRTLGVPGDREVPGTRRAPHAEVTGRSTPAGHEPNPASTSPGEGDGGDGACGGSEGVSGDVPLHRHPLGLG